MPCTHTDPPAAACNGPSGTRLWALPPAQEPWHKVGALAQQPRCQLPNSQEAWARLAHFLGTRDNLSAQGQRPPPYILWPFSEEGAAIPCIRDKQGIVRFSAFRIPTPCTHLQHSPQTPFLPRVCG